MPNFRSTLGLKSENEPKPSKFKITCTGNVKSGPNVISWEIEAPDAKTAARESRRIIMLGRYTVEPV